MMLTAPGRARPTAGRRRAGAVDQLAELVPPGDAELRVKAVQLGGDGMRRKEQPVGDLGVSQAMARSSRPHSSAPFAAMTIRFLSEASHVSSKGSHQQFVGLPLAKKRAWRKL